MKAFDLNESLSVSDTLISKEQFTRLSKLFSPKNLLTSDKKVVLSKISEDIFQLSKNVKKFQHFGLIPKITIHGQCISQYILNKHQDIKSLDVHVYLDFNQFIQNLDKNFYIRERLKNAGISLNDFKNLKSSGLEQKTLINKIIRIVFPTVKIDNIDEKLYMPEEVEKILNKYNPNPLYSHCKTISIIQDTNYPINVKITNDIFDILKVESLHINQAHIEVENNHSPSNCYSLVSNLDATLGFFADIHHQKISVDLLNNKNDVLTLAKKCFDAQLAFPQYVPNPYYDSTKFEPSMKQYFTHQQFSDNLEEKFSSFNKYFLNLKLMDKVTNVPSTDKVSQRKSKI